MERLTQWCLTLFLPVAISVGGAENMLNLQSHNEGFAASPRLRAVAVDGRLDDWNEHGAIRSFADWKLRDRFSVRTRAMWDEDFLYLGFEWRDPLPLNSRIDPRYEPGNGWKADAVQLRVSAGGRRSWGTAWCFDGIPCVEFIPWQFAELPGKYTAQIRYGAEALQNIGIASAYRKNSDGTGFTHELKIPWKLLYGGTHRARAGESIALGMEFLWGASDGRSVMHRYADNLSYGNTTREFFWMNFRSWGELRLAAKPVSVSCRYVPDPTGLTGAIPIRAELPVSSGYFTLVIEDAQGRRIRNLAAMLPVSEYADKRGDNHVTVPWDGTDDAGNPVAPGPYRARGITRGELSAHYEGVFYNPGNPPWPTLNGRGAWGADHTPTEFVVAAGTSGVALGSRSPEGGYGIWRLDAAGKKLWSERMGVRALAGNARYVFALDSERDVLWRLAADTGKYAPFPGKPFPLPIQFSDVLTLAADEKNLIAGRADGSLEVFDSESGDWRRTLPVRAGVTRLRGVIRNNRGDYELPNRRLPLALADGRAAFIQDGKIVLFLLKNDKKTTFPCPSAAPTALTFLADGAVAVADGGAAMRVFRCDGTTETPERGWGIAGGRPRQGKFDSRGLRNPSSIAADSAGRMWVTEFDDYPRRISVWNADGPLYREYFGNTGYSGTGAFLHDDRTDVGYLGPNEFRRDPRTGRWTCTRVLWNPDPAAGIAFRTDPGNHAAGHIFHSEASGKRREYWFRPSDTVARDGYVVLMSDGDIFRPVSAISTVGYAQSLIKRRGIPSAAPSGELAGLNAYDTLYWNDGNRDGLIQRAECTVVPALRPAQPGQVGGRPDAPLIAGWGHRMDPADLSFYGTDVKKNLYRIVPVGFSADGAPIFQPASLTKLAPLNGDEMVPVPGGDLVAGFIHAGYPRVVGIDKKTGKIRWSYPNPYPGVHGSHAAPMPRPGMLIGPVKVMGVVPGCGEAGTIFGMRGNLGQDFYLTADGLFAGSMFRDCRLPALALPETEDAMRKLDLSGFSMGSEPFNGWLGRRPDGAVRMLCNLAPQAATVVRLDGFETFRRFRTPEFKIGAAQLTAAARARAARTDAVVPPLKYRVARTARWEQTNAISIQRPGQPVEAVCRMRYDDAALHLRFTVRNDNSPWKNAGTDFTRLFKTGDALALEWSATGNRSAKPVVGDMRILLAPLVGRPVAVRMLQRATEKSGAYTYQSPVGAVKFDSVVLCPEIRVRYTPGNGEYTVEASIPWRELGGRPQPGVRLRGDVGMILSDAAGQTNIARVFRSNSDTNLVSDMPLEAALRPDRWGEITLEE